MAHEPPRKVSRSLRWWKTTSRLATDGASAGGCGRAYFRCAVPTTSDREQRVPSESLLTRDRAVRAATERLCEPLAPEDYHLQPVPEASPAKWHLAHTSWFFETFLLGPHAPGYRPFHPAFAYLFNSYYE